MPFREWCEQCVAGKCKAKPHFATTSNHEESSAPLVAFDYAFMRDEEKIGEDERGKMLVGRDRTSRCYCCIAVPQKGVDAEEYSTRRVLRFLDFLGYESVSLKADQESSLLKKY